MSNTDLKLDMKYGEYEVLSNSMEAKVVYRGKTVKRFKGETAHTDADRYAYDTYMKERVSKAW
jgi:hypothetical protein